MPNVMRTTLHIQGPHVQDVLNYIGFNPGGTYISPGTPFDTPGLRVLIDFNRVVPKPAAEPPEGWTKWYSRNWGSVPYDGYSDGDIIEISEHKASFKFHTKWTAAYFVVHTLAKRFSDYSFQMLNWETGGDEFSDALWKNGRLLLHVQPYAVCFQRGIDDKSYQSPALVDPPTACTQRYAEALFRVAVVKSGIDLPIDPCAVEIVAHTIHEASRVVTVEVVSEEGEHYFEATAGPVCALGKAFRDCPQPGWCDACWIDDCCAYEAEDQPPIDPDSI